MKKVKLTLIAGFNVDFKEGYMTVGAIYHKPDNSIDFII